MIRVLAAIIILATVTLALLASSRAKPLLIDRHSSGAWAFNNADVPRDSEAPPSRAIYDLCPYEQPKDPTEIHRA